MPSYRVAMGVGLLRPGAEPADVLPSAAAAARTLATVEASDIAVVSGEARITVRFTVPDDDRAFTVAQHVVATVESLAVTARPTLTRRAGPRWTPVHASP